MTHLVVASAAFIAMHAVSSTPLRAWLVSRFGQRPYLGLYSVAALAALLWMIWAYRHAPVLPLWSGWRYAPLTLMPFSLVLLVTGYLSSNPTAILQERRLQSAEPARGVVRITRHPLMWGIALWAFAHVLARGDVKSLVFFGSLLLLALIGTVLIDRRRATLGEDWRRFAAVTSNVPFIAIARGRNRFVPREIGYAKPIAGLTAFVVVLLLHPYLFGVSPY